MTVQNYLSYFDEMFQPTLPMFRLVPTDKVDWRPFENAFTLGQLMAHMAISLRVYGRGLAAGDWGVRSMREVFVRNRHTPSLPVNRAIALLEEGYKEFKASVSNLQEEEFNEGFVDSPQLGPVPRWRLAMLAVEHHVNHRAELFMCLKMLGIKVNTGTLYQRKKESSV